MAKAINSRALAKELLKARTKGKDHRKARTVNLSHDAYVDFQEVCRAQGESASDVLDEFIKAYAEEFRKTL